MTHEAVENYLLADWPAPRGIHALVTTRIGGVSKSPYETFNLAQHVGDDASLVQQNRQRLQSILEAYSSKSIEEPVWISQVHGTEVLNLDLISNSAAKQNNVEADAVYSSVAAQPCLVQTADCLPVLFCDDSGQEIAAAHAGWRGLAAGILEDTLARFSASPSKILAWMGPAIGPERFEVGIDVYESFVAANQSYAAAFQPVSGSEQQKWLADLYKLARWQLEKLGITRIYGGDFCTYQQSELFYSYRRDGATGRMASVIWRSE